MLIMISANGVIQEFLPNNLLSILSAFCTSSLESEDVGSSMDVNISLKIKKMDELKSYFVFQSSYNAKTKIMLQGPYP